MPISKYADTGFRASTLRLMLFLVKKEMNLEMFLSL